ncbi:MAG TPA: amino acid adenylation domain-containing protein, partial [Terrimicrobiaceae bacterium]
RAYDSQEVPFEKLVEELKPERQLNRNPFFDISFSLQNMPTAAVNVPDLGIDLLRLDNKTSKFDLSVAMVETSRGLLTTVEYSTDLFDSSTAVRLLTNYRTLLEGIIADPRQTISRLPMMTEAERNQIVVEWNATGVEYPRDRCIHELFASQARRDPQAIAAVFGEQEISYGELERRSGRLAGHLRALGVVPGARVAICVDPSVEMIVGLLAILKAGAAYVPIDPEYPEERIDFMLAETEAAVVLAHRRLAAQFSGKAIKSVWLDGGWEALERIEDVAPPLWAAGKPDDVAYVMFTSGSTGKPKGVCVPHRAVNRLVVNCDYVRLGPEDVVAQVSNCCFDAATFEIWGALLNGSRLAGIERERVLSAESFSAELARHQVTTLVVTTALFNELAHERAETFCTVHNVLFGGEQCDAGAVRKVIESRGPPQRLLNVYGPTETTTFATWYEIKAGENFEGRIPIGRPIANTEVYILDGHCNPVPVGVAGEICIGGDGVAKGYLNRVELTAERFIASPFASGQRLYRTGDQGRFLPDGNIEFLGRLDHQVKLRGFRIELGEVEAALNAHPAVRQAVVCVRDDEGAVKMRQLVAYVVPVHGSGSTGLDEGLRAFLKEKLPHPMVPSAVVVLKEFPLTSNGKIDRKALPEPVLDRERGGYVAPCGETEKAVAEAWSAVLCVENIGAQESFFDLGGHSLMVTRVISRLRSNFGIDIPLRMFFENPTVAAIAAYIEGARCTAGPFPAGTLDREEFVL